MKMVTACLMCLLCLLCLAPVYAAPPTAGQLSQQLESPQPRLKDDNAVIPEATTQYQQNVYSKAKVKVTGFTITGATAISQAELQAVVADAIGQELTINDISDYCQRLTSYYHDAGYVLARAYLPPQRIATGIVTIAIL